MARCRARTHLYTWKLEKPDVVPHGKLDDVAVRPVGVQFGLTAPGKRKYALFTDAPVSTPDVGFTLPPA